MTTKRLERSFQGDGKDLYLDCGGGYTCVCIFQNSWDCILKIV